MRTRVAAAAVLVTLAVVAVAGVLGWRWVTRTPFEQAMEYAPFDAERITFTDWAGLRTELDVGEVPAGRRLPALLDRGFRADLTSTSALLESAPTLERRYGVSPASLEWELLSQSSDGAALLLRLPDSIDIGGFTDRLERLGYSAPPEEDGVWEGGPDLIASIDVSLTPLLGYVAVRTGEQVLVTSDNPVYLDQVVDSFGQGEHLPGIDEVAGGLDRPLSAVVYSGEHACGALAMGQADPADQAEAEALVEAAGEVNPMRGFAMGVEPDRRIRVVMAFESEEQARVNADSRNALVRGPAPGQGGEFSDRFSVESVRAEDTMLTMRLRPRRGQYVLSDLSSGPVLFATC